MTSARASVVLDTSVIYANAQPWEITELRALSPVDYVVPPTVLFELDRLVERSQTRARARSALNVLKKFVERGATGGPVTCGAGSTLRLAAASESECDPNLDLELADDRILACALHLQSSGDRRVAVATVEFALYAKARTLGLDGVFLPDLASVREEASLKERASFKNAWARVEAADSPWILCLRLGGWFRTRLVERELVRVREDDDPPDAARWVKQFDQLWSQWTPAVDLETLLKPVFGIDPAGRADQGVKHVREPTRPAMSDVVEGAYSTSLFMGRMRPESPDERALRISDEQEQVRRREEFVMESILGRAEIVREHIIDVVGEGLL